MKKPFLIATSLTLVVLIAFVYFSQPIKAKADQPALTYETTTSSLSDVKAMITGMEAALIPIVFIVIGFIALTYCTLRNVNVPLQYPSGTSFIDKCSELGHYVFDNATDAIKNVLYSVATFVASGQITDPTAISSTLPFLIKSVGKFFSAFGIWLSSSFVNNVQPIAEGLLNMFKGNPLSFISYDSYSYTEQYITAFNSVDDTYKISPFNYLAWYIGGGISNIYLFQYVNDIADKYIVFDRYSIGFYTLNDGVLSLANISIPSGRFIFASSGQNVRPNLSSYNHDSISIVNTSNIRIVNDVYTYSSINSGFLGYLSSLCLGMFNVNSNGLAQSYAVSDLNAIYYGDLASPWSDQVYSPTDDELGADIDDIADKLGEGATIGSLAALIALLTQDKALTLGTAITDVQTINSAGDYNFPSMDNIWKYPQYFFDMLHGWGVFVKGCLGAVTVGEGGLSWIFYGGFVLLICGGIIGKILLG